MNDCSLSYSRQSATRTGEDPPSSTIPTYLDPKNLQRDDIINISISSTKNGNGKKKKISNFKRLKSNNTTNNVLKVSQ